jgi:heat shock protein HslJ
MTATILARRGLLASGSLTLFLALAGCASPAPPARRPVDPARSPEAIVGRLWQWEATTTPAGSIDVPHPERYTLQLLPDGKFAAQLDCNRGNGGYVLDEGALSLSRIASTRAACPPGSLDARFARELGRVQTFRVEGGKLLLDMVHGEGTMRFRPGS